MASEQSVVIVCEVVNLLCQDNKLFGMTLCVYHKALGDSTDRSILDKLFSGMRLGAANTNSHSIL